MADKKDEKSKVAIEVRADGIYIIIDNSMPPKVSRKEVLGVIEAYGIKDIDFTTVNEIFKDDSKVIQKKISENTQIVQKKEAIVVEIARDRMSASIKFSEPVNGGAMATKEEVMAALAAGNVKFGIDESTIVGLMKSHRWGVSYKVADGKKPIDGKNGYIDFNFNIDKKNLKPKLLDNGNVDFRSLNLIEMVTSGQRLLTVIPPEDGVDGCDVVGTMIPYKRGKAAQPVIRGQNVRWNATETEAYADVSGQVLYINRKLSVSPILEIQSNVDNNTGNIKFNGSVVIRGNVVTGFTVEADGNIDIHGTVEGAKIISGYNIFLMSGVQGADKAEIIATGDITTKFAENCTLKAGRNIMANSIMHSNVNCDGKLELAGKNGLLVGGTIMVTEKITARVIGSTMATSTEITVGNDPSRLEEYKELTAEFTKQKREYDKVNTLIQKLSDMHKQAELPEDKKNTLLKSLNLKNFMREQLEELQKRINELVPKMDEGKGEVVAYDVIHSGVKVTIGNAVMFVRDDLQNCILVNNSGKISIKSAV